MLVSELVILDKSVPLALGLDIFTRLLYDILLIELNRPSIFIVSLVFLLIIIFVFVGLHYKIGLLPPNLLRLLLLTESV